MPDSENRPPMPWSWFGPYLILVALFLGAVLLLLTLGQDLVVALGVPAAVSAVAVAAIDRLSRSGRQDPPARPAVARRRRI